FHARVAREKSFLFQYAAQLGTELNQSPGDSVLHCVRLAMHSTTVDGDHNIEFAESIARLQRPLHQHLLSSVKETLFQCPIGDCEGAGARPKNHTGCSCLSAARALVLN